MSRDNVLVTGANGFVGRALVAALARNNISVSAAIRQNTSIGTGNLVSAIPVYTIGNIGPQTDWTDALCDAHTIIHLAARVHIMEETAANPLTEFRRVNTLGTEHLAMAAVRAGVRRLVYVSSIKVNGETTATELFRESDVPNPTDPYAISKWEAEQALSRISGETGLEVVIVRPPLVYGPGVSGNFCALLRWVNRGVPLPLASIENRRSLIGLENFVDLLITCATHPKASGEVFLASDGENLSTPELLRRVALALAKPARLFSFPVPLLRAATTFLGQGAQFERLCGSLAVDSRKSREVLGWMPPFSVDEGLRSTAAWFLHSKAGARD